MDVDKGDIPSDGYLEAVLHWEASGPADEVVDWFEHHGFTVLPLREGILIAAEQTRFEATFEMDLDNVSPPVELEVPAAISANVATITISPIRQITV